jgi:hypothetical protein
MHGEPHPALGKRDGDGAPDTTRASGHERDPPAKLHGYGASAAITSAGGGAPRAAKAIVPSRAIP